MHALSKAMGSVPGLLENSGGDGRAEQCSACGGYITWWQEAPRGGYIMGQEADLYLGSHWGPCIFLLLLFCDSRTSSPGKAELLLSVGGLCCSRA